MVAEVITESPISISESALVQLQRIRTEQNIPEGHGLRVGVKGYLWLWSIFFSLIISVFPFYILALPLPIRQYFNS